MREEFVPYDIALAMKELGFKEGCIARFRHRNSKTGAIPKFVDEIYSDRGNPLGKNHDNGDYCLAVPLYQQALRWFRREFNLISFILNDNDKQEWAKALFPEKSYYYEITNVTAPETGYPESITSTWFKTYEEAQDACLRELLELVLEDEEETEIEDLYPIRFNGETCFEKDCDEVFVAFYHDRASLSPEGFVYVGDGVVVYPDGEFESL